MSEKQGVGSSILPLATRTMLKKIIKKIQNKEFFKYLFWKFGLKKSLNIFLNYLNKIFLSKAEYLGIDKYEFSSNKNITEYIEEHYSMNYQLFKLFVNNKENVIHKWIHYIPIYESYISKFKDTKVSFLEIGVSKGGSMKMFREFLGNDALIFGVDIDERCKELNGVYGEVRIGSQDDAVFLDSVLDEMGSLDIVLDDGSHKMKDVKSSFLHLFKYLNEGGIYIIEDLHTSYWKKFGGGYNNKQNFFNFLYDIVNDMHHWYHDKGQRFPDVSNYIPAIHIYDSMVVIEKKMVLPPAQIRIPKN